MLVFAESKGRVEPADGFELGGVGVVLLVPRVEHPESMVLAIDGAGVEERSFPPVLLKK